MKRILIFGSLAGLLGLSLGSSQAFSQSPSETGDAASAPRATEPSPKLVPTPLPSPTSEWTPLKTPSKALPPAAEYPTPVHSADAKLPPYYGSTVVPGINYGPNAWQPGGYTARRGRPYYYTTPGRNQPLYTVHEVSGTPWAFDHSAYQYHFGPGYYRHSEGGHYRFPYYTYRAPWYFPGHPIYNRDTNRPW